MNLFLIFQYGLVSAFVVLLGTFLLVMVSESMAGSISQLFGLYTKNGILKFLGIGMGGVLLALQALMSHKRAKAMEDAAIAQANAAKAQADATKEQAKANQNTEQGQRQERLKTAIEHLGHDKDSVRLGGAYELFHLAQDTKDLRQTVLDILCAHIRRTTGEDEYQKKHPSKPSEEIQSLLTLLFMQEHEVFRGCHINLQESWLNGAYLPRARLEKANLTKAYLQRTNLIEARMQRAFLLSTQMHGATLWTAQMHGAVLVGANLQDAKLGSAFLQDAFLLGADMQTAVLKEARLQGAYLGGAKLQVTDLWKAELQGTIMWETYLQGANVHEARLQGVSSRNDNQEPLSKSVRPYSEHIRSSIYRESDLSGVIFSGGLSLEDMESLVGGLSDEKAKELREILKPHIDQPISHELPEDSGAITGTYTEAEAEQWIAEYNEAMLEIPTESDN